MCRRVGIVGTDVWGGGGELVASIIRAEKPMKMEATRLRNAGSYNTQTAPHPGIRHHNQRWENLKSYLYTNFGSVYAL
jgi:hypothetical protein